MKDKAVVRVSLYGLISLVLYWVLLGIVPGLQTAEPTLAGELFPWVALSAKESLGQNHHTAALQFTGILLALFAMYGLALRELAGLQSRTLTRIVFVAGAVFLVIQVLGPAMFSQDPFAYATYGRVAAHGANPYSNEAAIADGDVFLQYWTSGYVASRYGPVWTLVSSGIAVAAGDHVGLTVLLYRGVAIAAALVTAVLVYGALRRTSPARAVAGAAFFLWNPLVVLESGANAHNDVFVAVFLMLALWLVLRGRSDLSLVPLVFSALVKVVTVAVVPLFLIMTLRNLPTWRARRRFLARSVALPLAAGAALSLWYPGTITSVVDAGAASYSYTNSLHELAFEQLRGVIGGEPEMARVPVYFVGWWLKSTRETTLRTQDGGAGATMETAAEGTVFLVRAPQQTDWAYVVNATTHKSGFVNTTDTVETERPALLDSDPVLSRLEGGPAASAAVTDSNLLLRVFSWLGFGVVWLVAAWRSTNPRHMTVGVTAVFLAAYWCLLSWFWPWYLIWALAPAALIAGTWPAWLTALLSATVLSLYALTGPNEWAYHYRALPAFILPLLLFAMGSLVVFVRRRRTAPAL